jgi:hypothetical protein
LLSVAVLSQSFTKFFIVVNFNANRNYIAKNICVKRNIENNDCQGCCHLKKQMKEDENSSKPNSSNSKEKFEDLFIQHHFQLKSFISKTFIEFKSTFINHYFSSFSLSFFHPPQF